MGEAITGDGEATEEGKEGDQHPPHVRSIPSNFSAVVEPMPVASKHASS